LARARAPDFEFSIFEEEIGSRLAIILHHIRCARTARNKRQARGDFQRENGDSLREEERERERKRERKLLPRGATTFRAPLAISQLYGAAARVPCRTIDLNRYVNAYVCPRARLRAACQTRLIRDDFYASAASLRRLVSRIERVFAARYRYRYRQQVWRPTLLSVLRVPRNILSETEE